MLIVLFVIATSAAVLALAAVRLIVRIVGWVRGRSRPRRRWIAWGDRVLFATATVGITLLAYGRWIEPRRVEITRVAVPALAADAAPIRIIHLSDIHTPTNLAAQRRLASLVAPLDPDVIAFTGDGVNARNALPAFRGTMRELAAIAPTYGVRGNTDRVAIGETKPFEGTGVREAGVHAESLVVRGTRLRLLGASAESNRGMASALRRSSSGDAVVVVLSHSPDYATDFIEWGADIVLAGHTHGGQVALPRYGAIWTASNFGKRYERGLYAIDGGWLYINRGIGMERKLPKIRIGARPEITLIELRPRGGG